MLREWLWAFYTATVVESGLLDPSYQSDAGTFDPDNLPDPADTSIAKAQDTANRAYAAIARAPLLITSFTISDTNNSATITLDPEQPDYVPYVQAKDFTGTPGASAFTVVRTTSDPASCVVTLAAAPDSGNSVTFDLILFPTF